MIPSVPELLTRIEELSRTAYLRGKVALSLASQRDLARAERDQCMVDRERDAHAFLEGFSEGLSRKRMLELFFGAVMPLAETAFDAAINANKDADKALLAYESVILLAIANCEGRTSNNTCLHPNAQVRGTICRACGADITPVTNQLGTGRTAP